MKVPFKLLINAVSQASLRYAGGIKMKIKPSKSRVIFQIFNYFLMLLATFICVYPFWYIVIYTFSDSTKAGIDPDCFITKGEDLTEKYTKGQYLGGYVNWHYGNWNKNARAEDRSGFRAL